MTFDDMTPTERIGLATFILAKGGQMTVRELSERLEITPNGARKLLDRLSRVVPLIDDGGVWRVLDEEYWYNDGVKPICRE